MIIGGKVVNKRPEEILVLPRGKDNIVFKALPVKSYENFDKLVGMPKPPIIVGRAGRVEDKNDEGYKQQMANYASCKFAFMCVESLKPSEIQWDSVVEDKPETWVNWTLDLQDNGFNPAELNLIVDLILSANTLSENRLQAARDAFLRGIQEELTVS